jgi:hypothetical protein
VAHQKARDFISQVLLRTKPQRGPITIALTTEEES